MKNIFFLILLLVAGNSLFSQSYNNFYGKQNFEDSLKFSKYRSPLSEDSVLTINHVTGGLKFLWKGGTGSVDSVTVNGSNICYWSGGIPTCSALPIYMDSITISGNTFCSWKAGVSTCHTLSGGVDSVTLYGNSLCGWTGGVSTCFNLPTYVDSVTVNGSNICYWSQGVATCSPLPIYMDSITINGSTFCSWKAGISTCHTLSGLVDSVTLYGTQLCGWTGGVSTCFSLPTYVDSVTISGSNMCYWKLGVATCYPLPIYMDSITINGNQFCSWKAGVSTCHTLAGAVDSVTLAGNILCGWTGGVSTCFTLPTYVDSVTLSGFTLCSWMGGVSTCYTIDTTLLATTYYVDSSVSNVYNYIDSSITVNNIFNGVGQTRVIYGDVVWDTLFNFQNTKILYLINGQLDSVAAGAFSITGSDPSLDRYTLVWADTLGNLGTTDCAYASPGLAELCQVDAGSQILINAYFIPAGSDHPATISNEVIYKENVEWAVAGTGTITPAYNVNPYAGLVSVRRPTVVAAQNITFTTGTMQSAADYTYLTFELRLGATFTATTNLVLSWRNGGSTVSSTLTLTTGNFNYNRLTSGAYQLIAIPMSAWTFTNSNFNILFINQLGANASGYQLDNVILQRGGITASGTVVTSFNTRVGAVLPQRADYTWYHDSASNTFDTAKIQFWNNGVKRDSLNLHYKYIKAGTGISFATVVDTTTISSSAVSNAVDSIWRTAGQDSIKYSINGRLRSIKDSSGGGGINLANNGLTKLVDTVQLGGTITTANTTITTTTNPLTISSTGGSGISLNVFGGSGQALIAESFTAGGIAGTFINDNQDKTSSYNDILSLESLKPTAVSNNFGSAMKFRSSTNGGIAYQEMGRVMYTWQNATTASRTSQFIVTGVNSTVADTLLTIFGAGQHKFNKYGLGNFTGTPAYTLQVDASGNVIEGTPSGGSGWLLTGNTGTDPNTNFLGTTDLVSLIFKTNGVRSGRIDPSGDSGNTSLGYEALAYNTTGIENTAIGWKALDSNTTGAINTAIGVYSLASNTTGAGNTAIGVWSLASNTTGAINTAIGVGSLASNTNGERNIGLGWGAGSYNITDSNQLFINSQFTNDFFEDTTQSIIYGIMGADSSLQRLKINGTLHVNDGTQQDGYVMTTDAAGIGHWAAAGGGGADSSVFYTKFRSDTSRDNLYAEIATKGTGTVTSVATGLGLSGGTITTTGTLLVDTSSASILSRQRADSTYGPALGTAGINTAYGKSYTGTATSFRSLASIARMSNNTNSNYNFTDSGMNAAATGLANYGFGHSVLANLTSGNENYGLGMWALKSLTTGSGNVAIGHIAMLNSTTASSNIAIGYTSLQNNRAANGNTAVGFQALAGDTSGANNVAIGYSSMLVNKSGSNNTALGPSSMSSNTSGGDNTAVGYVALNGNISGSLNVAMGRGSLFANTASANTALGYNAGVNITSGANNTILGYSTGAGISTGGSNTVVGSNVTGLAAALANTVIVADGAGDIRFYSPSTKNILFGTTSDVASSKLTISSTTQGLLIPLLTTTQMNAVTSPATGLKIFNTTDSADYIYRGIGAGWQNQGGSGNYTPTLTNVANVTASTAYACQYSRIGEVVTVSGEVDIDPTTTLTLTQLGVSLPVTSAIANSYELAGACADDLGTAARVAGDATNDRAEIRMTPVDVTNHRFSFTFTYKIL